MLHPLELDNVLNKGKKLWFDDNGNVWYGKDEDNLVSAEGIELSSGYKMPARFYVSDLRNAFLLGLKIGVEQALAGQITLDDF